MVVCEDIMKVYEILPVKGITAIAEELVVENK